MTRFALNREGAKGAKGNDLAESERTIRQRYRPCGQRRCIKLIDVFLARMTRVTRIVLNREGAKVAKVISLNRPLHSRREG